MKVMQLINLLSTCDGNADIIFRLSRNEDYRLACVELANEDDGTDMHDGLGCLCIMQIDPKEPILDDIPGRITIILEQGYYTEAFMKERIKNIQQRRIPAEYRR